MKTLIVFLFGMLMFYCAPMVCPEEKEIRSFYSQDASPKSYSAVLSAKYGPLRIPLFVNKNEGGYEIKTIGSKSISYRDKALCVDPICLDIPFSIDGLIFGNVLSGDEKVSCSLGNVVFEKDDQLYWRRFVFSQGQLKRVEILDKNRDKTLTINYGDRNKKGYYELLDVEAGGLSFRINIEEVRF